MPAAMKERWDDGPTTGARARHSALALPLRRPRDRHPVLLVGRRALTAPRARRRGAARLRAVHHRGAADLAGRR